MSETGRFRLLYVDAAVNLVLGVLLVVFHPTVVRALGVPQAGSAFYARILGAVLVGIGLALVVEARRQEPGGLVGLGLDGAVAINLSGGLVLAGLLTVGGLDLPPRGCVFLWALVVVLVGISVAELGARRRPNRL